MFWGSVRPNAAHSGRCTLINIQGPRPVIDFPNSSIKRYKSTMCFTHVPLLKTKVAFIELQIGHSWIINQYWDTCTLVAVIYIYYHFRSLKVDILHGRNISLNKNRDSRSFFKASPAFSFEMLLQKFAANIFESNIFQKLWFVFCVYYWRIR